MARLANGFYSFLDSYLKSMNKKDLINYIRTIEKNWKNQLITNDIQYNNCKKLLAEERNKAIEEFAERLKEEYKQTITTSSSFVRRSFEEVVDEIAEEMRGAE